MMATIILLPLSFAQNPGQVLTIGDCIRMLRPKYVLTDAEGPLAQGLRLCIAPLHKGEFGQVVENFSGSRMLRSERFLNDSQGPLPKRLSPLIVSLFIRELCQQIEAVGNVGMPRLQVLLDIFGIAGGFVLRAAAGAVAIDVPISPWLYIATLLGALLIALGKRRTELETLGIEAAVGHRRNLESYSVEFIDQLILVISSAALMTYALYTFSAENLPRNHSMMLTIPIVMYGLFRYLFLVRDGEVGAAPEDLLFRDRPLLTAVVVWALLAVTLLYLGR